MLSLVVKLESRFLVQQLMNALSLIYPQYWLQEDVKINFNNHLEILKKTYGKVKKSMAQWLCHLYQMFIIVLCKLSCSN
jgi:hypothetical protein